MSLTTVIADLSGTNQEIFELVKARTVTALGRIPGAELSGVLLSFGVGLVSFVTDKASATGTYSLIRDICVGLTDRFKPDGEVDFSDASNVALIDAFLANAEVAALLGQIPAQAVKDAILAKASAAVAEFPGVTLHDVIAVTDPALATQEITTPVAFTGISQILTLTTSAAMPESVNAYAEISHDGQVWQRVATVGLSNILAAGQYVFRVNPGPLVKTGAQIRVVLPYTVGAVIV